MVDIGCKISHNNKMILWKKQEKTEKIEGLDVMVLGGGC